MKTIKVTTLKNVHELPELIHDDFADVKEKVRTIEIDKDPNHFRTVSLFAEYSSKGSLMEQFEDGETLAELGIRYAVGDTMVIKYPLCPAALGHGMFYTKVYAVDDDAYHCEFISRDEIDDDTCRII